MSQRLPDASDNTEAFAKFDEELNKNPMEEFEIVFEDSDDVTLENAKVDGGAITEAYESPTIKINKDKK